MIIDNFLINLLRFFLLWYIILFQGDLYERKKK
ncbi:hypothetical protein HMPREF9728_01687 [Treponema denticola US-Trep]|nr:hypothetical protein HMPREF9728_01687 [Treponema denticola US-Trep]